MTGFYSLSSKTIKGKPFLFDSLKGRTCLIVNVASKCGYTSHYAGLQELYSKYKDQGLVVIGFPSTDFKQEFKSSEEIESFCSTEYGVTFPMMESVAVNGETAHPVYKWLLSQKEAVFVKPPKTNWNFEKYLINRNGELIKFFPTPATPESIEPHVLELLTRSGISKL